MSTTGGPRVTLSHHPLLCLPFRTLFLGGVLFSLVALAWWAYYWLFPSAWSPYGGPIWWHGHEMVFGFGMAVIGGFLLTAVQAWTGIAGVRGLPLLLLVASWLLGRLLLAFGGAVDPGWVAVADTLFPLLLTVVMAQPIIKARQWRNLMFVPLLLLLTLLNGASHWGIIHTQMGLAMPSLHAAIMVIILIISLLGGRMIPGFTAAATACVKRPPHRWLEAGSLLSLLLVIGMALYGFPAIPTPLFVPLVVAGAIAHGWRLSRWGGQHTGNQPLLWSLHLTYLFIPIGMLLLALWRVGLLAQVSVAMHALTVGAMGGMVLAMIARITLVHTGRPLHLPASMPLAFTAILLAALVRVVLPGGFPDLTQWGIGVATLLWLVAYGLYLLHYGPMLLRARPDGQAG